MRIKYIKAPREEWGEHKCICIFFGLSVYISPSVADSDLLCVLLVHYVTRTKSIHAILKTQIKLKLLRSSPPPVSFLGQFFFFSSPVWAVLLVCFQGSTKHAALLDNRQNRIRCFVVIHMPKTRDKKSLVISSLPPLRRPSAQGARS